MTDSNDLDKVAVAGQMSGHLRTGLGILEEKEKKLTGHLREGYLRMKSSFH